MRNRFLISAAFLMAGTTLAAAQGTSPGGASPAPSSPATQAAPAEKMAPADKSAPAAANAPATASPKASQSDTMAPKTGEIKKDTTAPKNADTKSPAAASGTDQKAGATDMKKDSPAPSTADTKSPTDPKAATGTSTADTKSAGAAPPPEKQSQIATAIKSEKVEEVTNVNFNISVGTVVPSTVHYYPVPSRIIEIYPEWRGYDFILVRGRYIILRPKTHEIVYIIEG